MRTTHTMMQSVGCAVFELFPGQFGTIVGFEIARAQDLRRIALLVD
jgi:hypothetical protein